MPHRSDPTEGTVTPNSSLITFLGTNDFNNIKSMNSNKKTLRFSQKNSVDRYLIYQNGNFRIEYQIEENGNQASSFEDAFIHLNKDFLKANSDRFQQGLKNRKKLE